MGYGHGSDPHTSGEGMVIEKIIKNLNRKLVIFDVGANYGDYSLLCSLYPENNIYSFEPSLAAFTKLQENTRGKKDIRSYNFGFSDTPGPSVIHCNYLGSGSGSVYKRDLEYWNQQHSRKTIVDKTENIYLDTIDNFCLKEKIDTIDLLKIDAEGHELSILHGARTMIINKKIDYIQFEFGGCNLDSRTYFKDFWDLLSPQYDFFRIHPNGMEPIKFYDLYCEVFLTVNYLLKLRQD